MNSLRAHSCSLFISIYISLSNFDLLFISIDQFRNICHSIRFSHVNRLSIYFSHRTIFDVSLENSLIVSNAVWMSSTLDDGSKLHERCNRKSKPIQNVVSYQSKQWQCGIHFLFVSESLPFYMISFNARFWHARHIVQYQWENWNCTDDKHSLKESNHFLWKSHDFAVFFSFISFLSEIKYVYFPFSVVIHISF